MKRFYKSGGLSRLMAMPTALAILRIALLLPIVWLCCARGRGWTSALLLLLSALAGLGAEVLIRRYDMTTEAGAALAAIAGGLTFIGVLLCLAARFRRLLIPAGLLVLRGVRNCALRIRRWEAPSRAGDCAHVCLYLLLFAHLLWRDIPAALSIALTVAACALILSDLLTGASRKKDAPTRRA